METEQNIRILESIANDLKEIARNHTFQFDKPTEYEEWYRLVRQDLIDRGLWPMYYEIMINLQEDANGRCNTD